jgi:hypothetical protein
MSHMKQEKNSRKMSLQIPGMVAHRTLEQEDLVFESNLDYIVSFRPSWAK